MRPWVALSQKLHWTDRANVIQLPIGMGILHKFRLCSIAVAAVVAVALFGWCVRPYVLIPPLLTDDQVLTNALGDAVTLALVRSERPGSERYAEPEFQSQGPITRLCSAQDVRSGLLLRGGCRVWRPVFDSQCRNDRLCAGLATDPTIGGDPVFARVVRSTLQDPCKSLPPKDESSRRSWPEAVALSRAVARRVLQCGKIFEMHGRMQSKTSDTYQVMF